VLMLKMISYNEREVKADGSRDDIKSGYNLWADLVDPTPSEILRAQKLFHLDKGALEVYLNSSKKPQIRVVDSQKFVVALDMNFQDSITLLTEGVYLFVGQGWLVTIHSGKVDLQSKIMALFEQKSKAITESSIDALFYSILANLVDSYEQLLTSIELTVTGAEQKTLFKPSKKMLEYLDSLSRQVIMLRRHFWHMRDIINYLTHTEEEKAEVKYLKIVYDDINQLVEMVESYRDTINSTRELYVASVSLQMSDTMRTLTLFSAILLPLTFISSMYGMNGVDLQDFFNLPPGFVIIIASMAAVTIVLFFYFAKKRWIFAGPEGSIVDEKRESTESKRKSFEAFFADKNNTDNDRDFSNAGDKVQEDQQRKVSDSKTEALP
jgi:magnesium transporter